MIGRIKSHVLGMKRCFKQQALKKFGLKLLEYIFTQLVENRIDLIRAQQYKGESDDGAQSVKFHFLLTPITPQ